MDWNILPRDKACKRITQAARQATGDVGERDIAAVDVSNPAKAISLRDLSATNSWVSSTNPTNHEYRSSSADPVLRVRKMPPGSSIDMKKIAMKKLLVKLALVRRFERRFGRGR